MQPASNAICSFVFALRAASSASTATTKSNTHNLHLKQYQYLPLNIYIYEERKKVRTLRNREVQEAVAAMMWPSNHQKLEKQIALRGIIILVSSSSNKLGSTMKPMTAPRFYFYATNTYISSQ